MTTAPTRPASRRTPLLVAIAAALALAACSSPSGGGDGDGNARPSASPSPRAVVTVAPAANATGVAPATPVVVSVRNGTITAVRVRSANGADAVEGALAPNGTGWTSKGKLAFGAEYRVEVTTAVATAPTASTFRTAATPSAEGTVRTTSVLGDAKTYGVGMPIILKLDRSVTDTAQRAAFEKMLAVRSTPATNGAWGWVNNREVHFRPTAFWAPNSTVHVDVDTAGRQLADGVWGRTDLTVDFKIGVSRVVVADAKSHTMTVTESGSLVRTIPVSLGKATFPSSSGTMVVIDKRPRALFDSSTYGLAVDAPGGYQTKVEYPMRLTWGGEFIHSAPWSVGDQGRRNVSHGCINVAPANAVWLYQRMQVGDPVTVRNTGRSLAAGNGYTDWSVSFDTWLKRSASGSQSTAG